MEILKNTFMKAGIMLFLILQGFTLTFSQPANDNCETATIIDTFPSDQGFLCFQGTTLGALPEAMNNFCSIGEFPTVWFQITTDTNATILNIQVTSDDFSSPTISVFRANPDCSSLQAVTLTQSNSPCVIGSNGEAEASGTEIDSNTVYYIAVSGYNTVGGEFELCVGTNSFASVCVIKRDIEITARSAGGPLTGPFFPGETVAVCMNVDSFSAAANGCQWFQGIVPVFGNGWDPSSFNVDGQPLNTTVNGNPMGEAGNGIYNTSTWDWFSNVDYHYPHPYHQVGDIDGNGTLDMCNVLYEADCPNLGGLTGACCGPCWDQSPGTFLPPGWFAYGVNGTCPTPGPPISADWGDGNTCGGGMGPWSFCFELTIRDFPACLEDSTTSDLSLGFFTFADGEVGSWTGSASNCAVDQPVKITLPMCCSVIAFSNEVVDPICSGNIFTYTINEPGIEFWEWTADMGSVTGAHSGQGGPGTFVSDTLFLPGTDIESVVYTFLGFAGGQCPVVQKAVLVDVYPAIEVILDPLDFCTTPNEPYTIVSEITGGTGNYEYMWSPSGETIQSITILNLVDGAEYFLTVTDEVGCADEASTIVTIGGSFPVEITAPVLEQCLQDGYIFLTATPNGGAGPYVYEWMLPNGTVSMGNAIDAYLTGVYIVDVTDSEGCSGSDSIMVILNESPVVVAVVEGESPVFCEGDSLVLSGVVTSGEAPFQYTWITPQGMVPGPTLVVSMAGGYSVAVEDGNGCTGYSNTIFVMEEPLPNPDLGPDTIVASGSVVLDAGPGFDTYLWSTGQAAQTISVSTTGEVIVCVTDSHGCMGCDTIYVEIITNTIDLHDSGYLNIFPNPNKGIFKMTGELRKEEELSLRVFNLMGQIIYQSKPEIAGAAFSKEIDLRKTVPGVYYMQVTIGNEKYTTKVVVD